MNQANPAERLESYNRWLNGKVKEGKLPASRAAEMLLEMRNKIMPTTPGTKQSEPSPAIQISANVPADHMVIGGVAIPLAKKIAVDVPLSSIELRS